MRKYHHLCHQEQPDVSHQTTQKLFILVLSQWYCNFYMSPELASNYNWWQVGSVLVFWKVYQKSKVCQALMYIQERNMVCGKLQICHSLVLDKNTKNNAYSTPFLHGDLNMDHKMVILEIGWFHNIFHIFVYKIRIILNMIFSVYPFYFTGYFSIFSLINESMFTILLR